MPQSIVLSCKKLNVNTEVLSIDRVGLHVIAYDWWRKRYYWWLTLHMRSHVPCCFGSKITAPQAQSKHLEYSHALFVLPGEGAIIKSALHVLSTASHLIFSGTHFCGHPEIRVLADWVLKYNGTKLPPFRFYALSSTGSSLLCFWNHATRSMCACNTNNRNNNKPTIKTPAIITTVKILLPVIIIIIIIIINIEKGRVIQLLFKRLVRKEKKKKKMPGCGTLSLLHFFRVHSI